MKDEVRPGDEAALQVFDVNGIRMRACCQGEGPLVLLCHGFPESWYSWRHQIDALADAGYRAVAPDMRGYGGTDAPSDPASYTMLHHVGDLVALVQGTGRVAGGHRRSRLGRGRRLACGDAAAGHVQGGRRA